MSVNERINSLLQQRFDERKRDFIMKTRWQLVHIDPVLLMALTLLISIGIVILYSATNQNDEMLYRQLARLALASIGLVAFAQVSPRTYAKWTPPMYLLGMGLVTMVLIMGVIGKGAQRWLDLGIIRFQPSEIMKLLVPMAVARYFSHVSLPPKWYHVVFASFLFLAPGLMVIKQPDLGTGLMIIAAGASVVWFAGISWRFLIILLTAVAASLPVAWHYLHDYQRLRVLTFLNPERDPLGAGYHIIQSKIAIGSGGLFGKGWLHGTQSQLDFLPEHATDFIFAVCGEEFGLWGCVLLIVAFLAVTARGLVIASQAQDTFSRLLAGSLSVTFFLSAFINMGMVTGLLPVVGLPLPLVSYGGTSMVTVLAGFGMIMSIATHRKLVAA